MAEKKLKLFNGRLAGYKHGYIAAHSRADAIRVAEESFGLRGWRGEITDYWHEGSWGDSMIGVTPHRGMFAETKDGKLVEFINRKPVAFERDDPQAWEAHLAKQRRRHEDLNAARQQEQEEKQERIGRLQRLLNVGVVEDEHDYLVIWHEGHRYEIREVE